MWSYWVLIQTGYCKKGYHKLNASTVRRSKDREMNFIGDEYGTVSWAHVMPALIPPALPADINEGTRINVLY